MARRSLPVDYRVPVKLAANYTDGAYETDIKRFTDTTGVTVTGGAASSITSEIGGVPMLKVTTAAGVNAEVQIAITPNVNPPSNGKFVFLCYLPDVTKLTSIITLVGRGNYTGWLSSTSTFAASVGLSYQNRNGWQQFALSRSFNAQGGPGFDFNTHAADAMKLRLVPVSGQQATVYFHSYKLVGRNRAKFVIGFDDTQPGIMTAGASVTLKGVAGTYSGRDIMDAYGYKGVLYVMRERMADGGGAAANGITWADLNTLKADGWDVQAHGYTNPVDAVNAGHMLLGPYGYATRAVASADATANTITASANHNMPAAGSYAYPIEFTGTDLPAPLLAGTRYFARQTAATVFKVYDTEADSLADTNAINLTSAGTAANFGFRYWGSANDDSAVYADYQALKAELRTRCGVTPLHLATNQGGADSAVMSAAARAGFLTLRSVSPQATSPYIPPAALRAAMAQPLYQAYTLQLDAAGLTEAQVQAHVDLVCRDGALGHAYIHDINNTTGQALIWLCDYLEVKQKQGLIDPVTISDWYRGLSGVRRAA